LAGFALRPPGGHRAEGLAREKNTGAGPGHKNLRTEGFVWGLKQRGGGGQKKGGTVDPGGGPPKGRVSFPGGGGGRLGEFFRPRQAGRLVFFLRGGLATKKWGGLVPLFISPKRWTKKKKKLGGNRPTFCFLKPGGGGQLILREGGGPPLPQPFRGIFSLCHYPP